MLPSFAVCTVILVNFFFVLMKDEEFFKKVFRRSKFFDCRGKRCSSKIVYLKVVSIVKVFVDITPYSFFLSFFFSQRNFFYCSYFVFPLGKIIWINPKVFLFLFWSSINFLSLKVEVLFFIKIH